MKIFISWSKEESRKIAEAMKTFLEGLFHDKIETWLSFENIPYGTMHTVRINQALYECEKCIVCLTEDNYNAPWIMYEVGAISGHSYNPRNNTFNDAIFPILFTNIKKTIFQNSPLSQFQMVDFNEKQMKRLTMQINSRLQAFRDESILQGQFQLNWEVLNKTVYQILEHHSIDSDKSLNCQFLLTEFEKNDFPSPDKGDVIKYYSGFETQRMYEVLFNNANKRIWFFGRKNRKLFSNDNRAFFQNLENKIKNGFDFKCLFANPNINEIVNNAQKIPNFKSHLEICIQTAFNMLIPNNVNPNQVCKTYSTQRTDAVIVIDNVVLFSHIHLDENNTPEPLTNSVFYMADIESQIGKRYASMFCSTWKDAENIVGV